MVWLQSNRKLVFVHSPHNRLISSWFCISVPHLCPPHSIYTWTGVEKIGMICVSASIHYGSMIVILAFTVEMYAVIIIIASIEYTSFSKCTNHRAMFGFSAYMKWLQYGKHDRLCKSLVRKIEEEPTRIQMRHNAATPNRAKFTNCSNFWSYFVCAVAVVFIYLISLWLLRCEVN